MKTLTVFTPAYNRAHTLPRTYESLLRQTSKDFEWLVIDDGSTDGTRELVEGWIAEAKIPIRYIYQENQGMHGAHNTAYRNINTELNTCIDSDDFMPDEAVEKIVTFWKANGSDKYAGIIGRDWSLNGERIGAPIPQNIKDATLNELYAAGIYGDKKLVYRTDVIKRYPEYPVFKGERYVGLAYKYMLIDLDYRMLILEEPLVVVDYQLDGSSFNMYNQYWRNPQGFSFYRKTEMIWTTSIKRRFMSCVHYVASSIISKNRKLISESPRKFLTILASPFGLLWYLIIRHKVNTGAKMIFKIAAPKQ